MLALRGSYLCCTQLAHSDAFRFGLRLSRLSGYFIRMANAIKPMFFCYPDGKCNKTNVWLVQMANAIKPMIVFAYSGSIRMANARKPMRYFAYSGFIRMANAIKPMRVLSIRAISGWQTQ